jgi:hypothetical protein
LRQMGTEIFLQRGLDETGKSLDQDSLPSKNKKTSS